jgi:hypothetical protein
MNAWKFNVFMFLHRFKILTHHIRRSTANCASLHILICRWLLCSFLLPFGVFWSVMVQVLMHSEALVRLHLDTCIGVRDEDMVLIAMRCTQLKYLSLRVPSNYTMSARQREAAKLTDTSLKSIAEHCLQLEEVAICSVDGDFPSFASFSGVGVSAMVQWCPLLRRLTLDAPYSFGDSCMQVTSFVSAFGLFLWCNGNPVCCNF